MKKLSFLTVAGAILLTGCTSQPSEKDYINAFMQYTDNSIDANTITLNHTHDITVGDSIAYLQVVLADEYQNQLDARRTAWEEKQADCEKDELANILRHEDYMKKYNEAKRKYGNNIKYQSKIEGYLKAAEKLPSNHEEYLEFDRRRSYSFTRDAENLKTQYDELAAMGLEGYAANHPMILQYSERNNDEVLANVYTIGYTFEGETIESLCVFAGKPIGVIDVIDTDAVNILNYNQSKAQ